MSSIFGRTKRKPPKPPPVVPPPPGALTTLEVFVHDITTPEAGLGGALVAVTGGETRQTNPNGTAHFDLPVGVQADLTLTRPGYEPQTASAVPGIDARVAVWMQRGMPVPGAALPRLRAEGNKRWLAADGQRFDYREKGAFTLLGRLMAGQDDYVRDYLRWAKAERFTVLRVFICTTGKFHEPTPAIPSGPHMAGFWPACDRLLDMFTEAGLYMRPTMIAATEPFGGVWQGHGVDIWNGSVRERGEQFCVEFASRYRDHTTVGLAELFNEPVNIGLRRSQEAVIGLGRKVKAVAPEMLLCGGYYEDETMCARPFDLVSIHYFRAMEVGGFNWIKRASEYPPTQKHSQAVEMAVLSGEPANFGQWRKDGNNGDVVRNVSAAMAYAAMSRAHMFLPNFHSDDALYTEAVEDITLRAIRAFHDGLDAFPMLTGNPWTGHHGQGQGDFWRDVWPPKDEIAEQWIREGRGPWRAYGNDRFQTLFPEPKGWDWHTANEAPMERVAYSDDGDFAVGIYRRT